MINKNDISDYKKIADEFISEITEKNIEIVNLNKLRIFLPRKVHKALNYFQKSALENAQSTMFASLNNPPIDYSTTPYTDLSVTVQMALQDYHPTSSQFDSILQSKLATQGPMTHSALYVDAIMQTFRPVILKIKTSITPLYPIFTERPIMGVFLPPYKEEIDLINRDFQYFSVAFKPITEIFEYSEYSTLTQSFLLFDSQKNFIRQIVSSITKDALKTLEDTERDRRRKKAQRKK